VIEPAAVLGYQHEANPGMRSEQFLGGPFLSGTATVKTFAVTAGGATSLDMSRLPAGSTTFTGDAFDVACASIGTAAPVWEADPTVVTLQRGVVTVVGLEFRKRNSVVVSANFIGNIRKLATGDNATFLATDARASPPTRSSAGATT
jgi:hypothetical protein